ncbi:hypothetical protein GE061_000569 [Apolygus lucorum]|uniref:AB hydrolase-1 domain-containing protein n=1 Tax=Apolygus lucorum TaxID=248454 RepID=A0A8S9Y675_APOLU|nr:hypothetical protein GE061_000569 [Apolygus lucorum]
MAEEPQSAIAKASAFIRKYVIPLAITVIMYLIGLFWGLVVVFRIVNRYRGDIGKVFVVKKRPLPPKILDDPELGNHCYIQLPNIKLHYVESGDKSKPLLILLHGFPEFWYCWRHQIKEFSKDYWVVAVDLRGYGDSEKPPSVKYYSMKYLSEDVKNLIEGLGRQKAILVAHDWGGIAAWSTVLRYPEMIEKFVILNAPHPVAFNKHLVSSLKQFLQSWYMFFFQLPFLPELFLRADDLRLFALFFKSKKRTSVLNEEELEAYKFTYGKPGATFGPLAYYRANILGRYRYSKESDKKKATPSSDLPKGFLLFGDEDVALDVKLVELSKAAYPNLETEIIPGACHFVQEDEPVNLQSYRRLEANLLVGWD